MDNAPTMESSARAVVKEHVELRRLLAQIEGSFQRPTARAGIGPDEVAARLDTLRGPLRAHFDEEERNHLFEEIEALAPEQAGTCARLLGEHTTLIGRLDTLRSASPVERRGAAWAEGVRSLLADLASHEQRETELLTRTLDGSTEAQD